MKAKYSITSYTCPMCNKEIDGVIDNLHRDFDSGAGDYILEYYTCSRCGFKGRIFFNFVGQEGLPSEHTKDEDWSYAERVEPAEPQESCQTCRKLGKITCPGTNSESGCYEPKDNVK